MAGLRAAAFWAMATAGLAPGGGGVREASAAMPPGSETCAECHETGTSPGRREAGSPPAVDYAAVLRSPHAELECSNCHADLAGGELPHAEKLQPVDCGGCHGDAQTQWDESLHGQASRRGDRQAPRCATCHGTHAILRRTDPDSPTSTMNVPTLCGRCHHEGSEVEQTHDIPQAAVLENYSESIHGEGLFKKGLIVTAVCTSCHTSHHVLPHTDPRSSIAHDRIADTCMQCHARIEDVHRKVIRGELWETAPKAIPVCVDCHSPHKVRKVFYSQGMADRDCMRCHAQTDLQSQHGVAAEQLYVKQEELAGSRHAKIACVQCHTDCTPSLLRPCETVAERVDCSICHAEVVDKYRTSTHGKLSAQGSPDAPVCRDCHGDHGVLGKHDTKSRTFARNVPALCGQCHQTGKQAAVRYKGEQTEVVEHYVESIHGKGLLESGLTVTATCVNCHTAHGELPASDPASTVHVENVATTCSQCHHGIYELFNQSIHAEKAYEAAQARARELGQAVRPTADGPHRAEGGAAEQSKKFPTCSTCHSAHSIARTDLTDFRLHIMDQCGECHGEIAASYFDTYHGKVSKLGYVKTAKCYDCHGAHDILPVWDPKSHLSRSNIVATCGQCHPGSNRRFAGYLTHATHHDPKKYPFLFYTFWGMTLLLLGTLTVAGLHTLAWIPKSIQFRRQLRAVHAAESKVYVRRFAPFYSKLHLMVIVSFFALALTGMSLKFSYTGWARVMARLFGGFETAGNVHRAAAIVTFAYFALHLWDLFKRKRREAGGMRKLITGTSSMLPNITDLKEFVGSIKWFLGRGPRPQYGRWTYWEKFDYFAVFWGVAMIGVTGLVLWMPELFTRVIPGWALNVATIIHSDEALLAVGFIFTIHFFNTHFRPEKFPMDPVIFTGRIPLEEFKLDRPREYAELLASGKLESRLCEPPSPQSLRFWRVFGFTALGIGLTLIALIVYGAIFAYR